MNIDKLKELEAKATPAKWVHIRGYGVGSASRGSVVLGMNPLDSDGEITDDQELVIALRNLAPRLIALWEAAKLDHYLETHGHLENGDLIRYEDRKAARDAVFAALTALENA